MVRVGARGHAPAGVRGNTRSIPSDIAHSRHDADQAAETGARSQYPLIFSDLTPDFRAVTSLVAFAIDLGSNQVLTQYAPILDAHKIVALLADVLSVAASVSWRRDENCEPPGRR
jgi:hypothetical protein